MANAEHLKLLKQGVERWNQWRENTPGVQPDLSNSHLTGADLLKATLIGANLRVPNLRSFDLSGANLHGAYLTSLDLSGANLCEVNLR